MIYERQIDGQHDRPVIAGTVMQYPRPLQLVAYLSTGQWALVNTIDKSASVLPVENGVTNQPRLSPDGRVLAYTVNQIAGPDVFLQPYPNGRRVAVSVGGGLDPEWSADGKELFYLTPDGWVMSVTIGHDTVPTVSQPARLFQIPLPNRERLQPLTIGRSRFQPGAHGRFLVSLPLSPPGSVTVRTAW